MWVGCMPENTRGTEAVMVVEILNAARVYARKSALSEGPAAKNLAPDHLFQFRPAHGMGEMRKHEVDKDPGRDEPQQA